jgi:hypothetical protein
MIDMNYDCTEVAVDIAERYEAFGGEYPKDRMTFIMDLMAANGCNGNPELRLDRMLHDFPKFDFMHDAVGIQNHINRETGQLEGCFLPRCAV